MNKFLINRFGSELEYINRGRIRISTAIKKIVGIICSNPIY